MSGDRPAFAVGSQVFVDLESRRIGGRIVGTDLLDESTVSGGTGICYDNSVKRSLLLSHSS